MRRCGLRAAEFWHHTGNGDTLNPRADIVTTVPGGYGYVHGTSAAAAQVAGEAILLYDYGESKQGRDLSADDLAALIKLSADPKSDVRLGAGRLNLWRGLLYADSLAFRMAQGPGGGGTPFGHDSVNLAQQQFNNVPASLDDGPALNGTYQATRVTVWRKCIYYRHLRKPTAWGVGSRSCIGYTPNNPTDNAYFCDVVSDSTHQDYCYARTYIYHVRNANGTHLGWYPCRIPNAQLNFSALDTSLIFHEVTAVPEDGQGLFWMRPLKSPAVGRVQLAYAAPPGSWTLRVYDVQGRRVSQTTVVGGQRGVIDWPSLRSNVPLSGGVYFYRFSNDTRRISGRFVFLK